MTKKAIFLMRPTAAGKTDAAMFLQDEFAGDIISMDSALVYRGMNINTVKPLNQGFIEEVEGLK